MDRNLQPLLAEFGAAVRDAQILEQGLRLAIALAAQLRASEDDAAKKEPKLSSLVALAEYARKRDIVTGTEEEALKGVRELRNELVHSFLTERAVRLMNPQGRREITAEIIEARSRLQQVGIVVDRIVDGLLKDANTSVADIKSNLQSLWVDDDEPQSSIH